MNKDCEIIKDLLPGYLGKILSKESEKFVNEHIKDCNECKEILQNMNNIPNSTIDNEEQSEINHLKKFSNKMKMLRLIIISLIIIFLVIIFGFVFKYNYKSNFMKQVNNGINMIKESDNYILKTTQQQIDYERKTDYTFSHLYYYKEGKYKIYEKSDSLNDTIRNTENIYYGKIDSNEQSIISENEKTITNYISKYNYMKKGDFIDIINSNGVDLFGKNLGMYSNIIFKSRYKIKRQRYNGKECYVLKIEDGAGYTEYWIEKERMIPIRLVEEIYNRFYTEYTYSITEGIVKDDDVIMPILEGYELKENTES